MIEPEENDFLGWDVERDGRMADYADEPVEVIVEKYDIEKDPVTKGEITEGLQTEDGDA